MAKDTFGRLLCSGVFALIVFSVFENVGMNMGIMPVAGIPLPFLSYGGLGHDRVLRRHRDHGQRARTGASGDRRHGRSVEVPPPGSPPDGAGGAAGTGSRRTRRRRRHGAPAEPSRSAADPIEVEPDRPNADGPGPDRRHRRRPMGDFRMALVASVTVDLPNQHPSVVLREIGVAEEAADLLDRPPRRRGALPRPAPDPDPPSRSPTNC